MSISPIDILHKEFKRGLFGYDTQETTAYLKAVAGYVEELIKERNQLRDQVREKDALVVEYKERDQVLKNTITTAQAMTERMREDAEKEARLISHQAQTQADAIVNEARESLKKIYSEISELRRVRMQFESNLRAMAQAHLSLLDQGEKFMPMMDSEVSSEKSAKSKSPEISPLSLDV